MKELLFLFLFLIPGVVFGAEFVPDSIWVSNSSPEHGDVLDIFVTVFNTSDSTSQGTVRYYDDEILLGEFPVTVSANSAKLVTLSWEATQGDRILFARFSSGTGSPEETSKIRIKVKRPIIPEVSEGSEGESGEEGSLGEFAGEAGVVVTEIAEDGFEITEDGREASSNFFQEKKENVKEKKQQLLAGENENIDSEFEYNAKKVMLTLLLWALSALVIITGSKIAFYVAIVLLIYFTFRIIRRRREAYYD